MKKVSKKTLTVCICVALVLALAAGMTLAYLSDLTEWKTNTFEFAEGLTVTINDEAATYKIVPGHSQHKDSTIVLNNPEVDAWLFCIVKEQNTEIDGKTIVEWTIGEGWNEMAFADPDIQWSDIMPEEMAEDISADNTHIYYRQVPAADETSFDILYRSCVNYPIGLTRDDIPDGTEIKLSFAARAIQMEGFEDAEHAWVGEAIAPEEMPNATMTALDPSGIAVADSDNSWSGVMDAAVTFGTTDTADDIADKDYKDWEVDFELSFNQDVDPASIHLFGSYAAYNNGQWLGEDLAAFGMTSLPAETPVRIMEAFGPALGMTSALTYTDITYIQEFNCGIAVENPASGLEATLRLIMIDGEGSVHVVREGNFPIG